MGWGLCAALCAAAAVAAGLLGWSRGPDGPAARPRPQRWAVPLPAPSAAPHPTLSVEGSSGASLPVPGSPAALPLHATPLWLDPTVTRAIDLPQLRRCVLELRQSEGAAAGGGSSLRRSNTAGGWHSATDLLDPAPAAACATPLLALREALEGSVARYGAAATADGPETAHRRLRIGAQLTEGWANVNAGRGDANSLHTHGSSHVSGVLYLSGDDDPGACTLLQNPAGHHPAGPLGSQEDICVPPVVGSVLLFPGWLPHAVLPHLGGAEPRITISFNAVFALESAEGVSRAGAGVFHEALSSRDWLEATNGRHRPRLYRAWATPALRWDVPGSGGLGQLAGQQSAGSAAVASGETARAALRLACALAQSYVYLLRHVRPAHCRRTDPRTETRGGRASALIYRNASHVCDCQPAVQRLDLLPPNSSYGYHARTALPRRSEPREETRLCGVLAAGTETGSGPLRPDNLLLTVRDPRPEYAWALPTAGGSDRRLLTLGLEAGDGAHAEAVALAPGQAVLLPCAEAGGGAGAWLRLRTPAGAEAHALVFSVGV
eukprot:COSAG04_NODE_262_length_18654_cov_17.483751_6_plen_549_part_00